VTTREELHRLIDTLDEPKACEVLEYIHWLMEESDTLTEEELAQVLEAEERIERGEYITLDQLERELGK